MHIASFVRGGRKWFYVVFEGATSDTYYATEKEAEEVLKKLKRLKLQRSERSSSASVEEYELDAFGTMPDGFSVFRKVVNGVLHVLLLGPVSYIRIFTGEDAVERARATAYRTASPTLSTSSDLEP